MTHRAVGNDMSSEIIPSDLALELNFTKSTMDNVITLRYICFRILYLIASECHRFLCFKFPMYQYRDTRCSMLILFGELRKHESPSFRCNKLDKKYLCGKNNIVIGELRVCRHNASNVFA